MMIVFVLISLFFGPVWSIGDGDGQLETVIAVTQCRALCLDQFSHVIRNEENCMKEINCFVCWDVCKMIIENFVIWGPICNVKDACSPGCQLACSFNQTEINDSVYNVPELKVINVYEPYSDRVNVEWVPDEDMDSESAVLYTVLLKDENTDWIIIAQTTSHVVHIKRGLLGPKADIRVVAANATKKVSDSNSSFVKNLGYEINSESMMKISKSLWKPSLVTLTKNINGLQATVTWPALENENGPTEYEVSWSATDETIEVTGHLHTSSNVATLTLWPNSLYSIHVFCLGKDKSFLSQSEPLVLDTKSPQISEAIERLNGSTSSCIKGMQLATKVFGAISISLIVFILLIMIWYLKIRRNYINENSQNKNENLPASPEAAQVKHMKIQHVSVLQQLEQGKIKIEKKLQHFRIV